jgi:hypothetical protein
MKHRVLAGLLLLVGGTLSPIAHAEIKEPAIMTREQWKAKPANTATMRPQGPAYQGIVVHHVGVLQSVRKRFTTAQKLHIIQNDHQQRPFRFPTDMKGRFWGDFAYHYYIDIDGQIAMARDPRYQGDSATKYDMSGQLLIVLDGDFEKEQPTREQLRSLDALVAWLAAKHNVKAEQITGHKDLARNQTPCPGKNLESYLPELREKTAAALKAR